MHPQFFSCDFLFYSRKCSIFDAMHFSAVHLGGEGRKWGGRMGLIHNWKRKKRAEKRLWFQLMTYIKHSIFIQLFFFFLSFLAHAETADDAWKRANENSIFFRRRDLCVDIFLWERKEKNKFVVNNHWRWFFHCLLTSFSRNSSCFLVVTANFSTSSC